MTILEQIRPLATRDPGLLASVLDDGRPAVMLTAAALFISGAFAVFLSFRREFLPHDVAFLGMTAGELCVPADCRIVRFMFHDRVAFGGSLMAIAILYFWLAAVPLREGMRWAWQALAVSGALGFASFLAYLGYGYLDSWHGAATLALMPVFAAGLVRSWRHATIPARGWLRTAGRTVPPLMRVGRWGLVATGAATALAGAVILFLGTTDVFVAEDLAFMNVTREALDAMNPKLVPLIAHDRAGFGGGLLTVGILVLIGGWYAPPARAFHQAVVSAGLMGFGCAIGVHFVEGYVNPVHLAPAFAGAVLFLLSVACEVVGWRSGRRDAARPGAR